LNTDTKLMTSPFYTFGISVTLNESRIKPACLKKTESRNQNRPDLTSVMRLTASERTHQNLNSRFRVGFRFLDGKRLSDAAWRKSERSQKLSQMSLSETPSHRPRPLQGLARCDTVLTPNIKTHFLLTIPLQVNSISKQTFVSSLFYKAIYTP
jgi:hypothetical protein